MGQIYGGMLIFKIEMNENHRCRIVDVKATGFRRARDVREGRRRRFVRSALSLPAAEKVRYRYRLDGVDTDWRELTAARQALYTNFDSGRFAFRVIAANNDGVWNESGASLAFVIPPGYGGRASHPAPCRIRETPGLHIQPT